MAGVAHGAATTMPSQAARDKDAQAHDGPPRIALTEQQIRDAGITLAQAKAAR